MPRKQKDAERAPTDIVQLSLRIREKERRKLEAIAKSKGVSMNGEILSRLWNPEMCEGYRLAEQVNLNLTPLLENVHELAKAGDLQRAADKVIALYEALLKQHPIESSAQDEIKAALEQYAGVKRMIAFEAAKRIRTLHTTGAQP